MTSMRPHHLLQGFIGKREHVHTDTETYKKRENYVKGSLLWNRLK